MSNRTKAIKNPRTVDQLIFDVVAGDKQNHWDVRVTEVVGTRPPYYFEETVVATKRSKNEAIKAAKKFFLEAKKQDLAWDYRLRKAQGSWSKAASSQEIEFDELD